MTSLPCMLVVLYSCINWCEIDFMWSILLMRTCFCVVSYSRCGLSGQERESVDSEKDEAGRSFGSAGTSAGGDGTGLLSPTTTNTPSHALRCTNTSSVQLELFSASAGTSVRGFTLIFKTRNSCHFIWRDLLVILGLSCTSNSDKRTMQRLQARRRTQERIPSHFQNILSPRCA